MGHLESELPTLLAHEVARFEPFFEHYGLWLVFGLILIEGVGVPAPGQTVLIVGGVLAARGQMNLYALLLTAWLAAIGGSGIGYLLGRYGGSRVLGWLPVDRARLKRVGRSISRNSLLLLSVARFVEGMKQTAGLIAGSLSLSPRRFLAGTLVGATLWTAVFGLGSWYLERRADALLSFYHRVAPWSWALLALLLGLLAWWLLVRRDTPRSG